ncbi:cys met metabolism pyridoxal phosphate-dependent enzyme [Fusarium sporotrichioides]|uniref:Cys met metabolism pyridoxal phosphate-dependent enzyme n=1 Tax=Fusarium sporotrichioides TaxID=5514 RepID=A0A395SKA3_FUSSP|nr:cys met metabolism pyridoxal phosphate-dependent enzyme [Fusarium sporotrichioides]
MHPSPMPAYVVGESSPFLKRVLVPLWCIRILVMLANIVSLALMLVVIIPEMESQQQAVDEQLIAQGLAVDYQALMINTIIVLILIFPCIVFDIICIIKRSRRSLSPIFFLVANVIQFTIWTVLFALSMRGGGSSSSIAIGIVIYLSFAGMLGYASYVYHQFRKGNLINQCPSSATDQLEFRTSNAGHLNDCFDQRQQPLPSHSMGYSHDKQEMDAYNQPLTELDSHQNTQPYAVRSELFAPHTPAPEKRAYTEEQLRLAIYEIKFFDYSLNGASRRNNVPRATLRARVRGARSPNKSHEEEQRLSAVEEKLIVSWFLLQDALGLAPTRVQITELATKFLLDRGDYNPALVNIKQQTASGANEVNEVIEMEDSEPESPSPNGLETNEMDDEQTPEQ